MLAALCYALLVGVFVIDVYTPQLFIASILLNVPIALSSLALHRRLTVALVVTAEAANAVAAYVNGVQAGRHWDAVAIGDRVLLAASFVLIGYMTIQTQRLAHSAGLSDARAELVDRERRLRLAFENVRASLSVEFVRRAVVREALAFFEASRAMLILDAGSASEPSWYEARKGEHDVLHSAGSLAPMTRSFLARDWPAAKAFSSDSADTIARHAMEELGAQYVLAAPVGGDEHASVLLLLRSNGPAWVREDERLAQAFADQASVALSQAGLFAKLEDQTRQIADQHQKLLERSNVIRDIVYALAHDLRTPLVAANVTMRQAQAGAFGELPAAYRDVLATTLRSNEELQRLVDTLMLVARYEAGEISAVREPVDLHRLAVGVGKELGAVAREKEVALAVDGEAATTLGDERDLRRALTNLVANALAATPAHGSITVSTHQNDDRAIVSVEDTGFGVMPADRGALFQRFGGAAARRPGMGTGLGLYIVQRIAQAHGGKASYEPLPARGSRFMVELPAFKEHA